MEPPPLALEVDYDEKAKVLRALVPLTREGGRGVDGPWAAAWRDGNVVKGYRQEGRRQLKSVTETYVAIRIALDNWRWAGVPFPRSGSACRRVLEIAVSSQPPLHLFSLANDERCAAQAEVEPARDAHPAGRGISLPLPASNLGFIAGGQHGASSTASRFRGPRWRPTSGFCSTRACGDPSLFTRSDEVDYAWRFITSIHEGWATLPPPVFPNYYPFTDGPDEANRLLEGTRARWRSLQDS
jgi:glucose-6-phosphate 1-dehydrogenase